MVGTYARYAQQPASESELIARHSALLDRCARRLSARSGRTVLPDDLWSAGAMGLLEAARRFDPAQNVRFESFAEHRIRGAMLDEMRRMDRLPRRLRAETEKVEEARMRLGHRLGREPTVDEIADELKADVQDVAELLHLLQAPAPVDELAVASTAEPDAERRLLRAERQKRLAAAIKELPERLQILLALYYDEELTYREIAKMMDVSEPRVCQLHSDAVKQLRAVMGE